MEYRIRLEQFEGPLDVLLTLIEKEKLDITEVSLAKVADQFLEFIEARADISLEHLASFLSVATRLILVKSRALLPILNFTEEEEEAIEDLELHLRIYQKYREAGAKLEHLFAAGRAVAGRDSFLGVASLFYPPKGLSKEDLADAFKSVLGTIPLFEALPEKELKSIITLEEKMLHLKESLSSRAESSFHEMSGNAQDKVEIIVSFLAMLELIKQRYIFVEQEKFFSDIRIKRMKESVS
ncbi:MAG: hypothetical protein A2808_00700 [Candidatus Moranbacteria bacterium RIFCSPHIGHO2_01_FULL_55_24]|nr:MAG: hypothetical protein A2808_00700 [Candidatus Moranbacteria bacterium RIFCSPHIGHO2_01_FULL_55_24]